MLEVLNYAFPSPEQWELAIKGMRLPKKSGDKSDSGICNGYKSELCQFCEPEEELGIHACDLEIPPITFVLGEKDKQLLLNLCKAGDSSHRKVLRQLPITLTVNAPLYWWKQADQYKVSTTTNSESTMHTLTKNKFTMDDFSVEDLDEVDEPCHCGSYANLFKCYIVDELNNMRQEYQNAETPEEKRKWEHAMIAWLPENYNQTRCWTMSLETVVKIIQTRKGHKNKEWDFLIEFLLNNVPYLEDIVKAIVHG